MNTYDELVKLLAPEFDLDPATIDAERDLRDYGLDSLALVDMMFVVEERFGIDLPSDTSAFTSLKDLALLVDRLLLRRAA